MIAKSVFLHKRHQALIIDDTLITVFNYFVFNVDGFHQIATTVARFITAKTILSISFQPNQTKGTHF